MDDKDIISAIHSQIEELVLLCKEHGIMIQHISVDWQEYNRIGGDSIAMLEGIRIETKTHPSMRQNNE